MTRSLLDTAKAWGYSEDQIKREAHLELEKDTRRKLQLDFAQFVRKLAQDELAIRERPGIGGTRSRLIFVNAEDSLRHYSKVKLYNYIQKERALRDPTVIAARRELERAVRGALPKDSGITQLTLSLDIDFAE